MNTVLLAERPSLGWDGAVINELESFLHESVLARGTHRRPDDRADSIIGYSMIEVMAADWISNQGLKGTRRHPLVRSMHTGAPEYTVDKVHCSLSHSDGLVAATASHCAVGIDVVSWSEICADDYRAMFTPNEITAISTARNSLRQAAQLWGMKESYSKAIRTGLTDEVLSRDFSDQGLLREGPGMSFQVREPRNGGRTIVLCTTSATTRWFWIDLSAVHRKLLSDASVA